MRREKSFREVVRALHDGANVVPLVREVPADIFTAVSVFLRLEAAGRPAFLLESVEGGGRMARYSFLGADPFETVSVREGVVRVQRADEERDVSAGNPFVALGDHLRQYRAISEPGLPRFCGGAVGFVGYEMVRHLEPTVNLTVPEHDEARLMLFRNVIAFDRLRHRMLLVANVIAETPGAARRAYRSACDSLDRMQWLLTQPLGKTRQHFKRSGSTEPPEPALGEEMFLDGVGRLKRAIRAGDIFQAVLSDRLSAPLRTDPFAIYRALRAINPSPYMYYIDMGKEVALGASPEMFVRVEGDVVETRPIAGTRPRGLSEAEDHRLEQALRESVKEKAEHIMLVDLSRNDVGRVARPGSVRVASFMEVERYSHVMHLVSSVVGRLKRNQTSWGALAACFPAGTVTGAPKIRAMQLVSEIERVPRGLYAGAVVYHDFRWNLDSAIAIRSVWVRRDGRRPIARVQSGAGIVADSRPRKELEEIRKKAGALWDAIRAAEEL